MHDAHSMWEMRECTGEKKKKKKKIFSLVLSPSSEFLLLLLLSRCTSSPIHIAIAWDRNIHMTRCVYNIACINACVCTCELVCVLNCQAKIDRNLLMCMLNASAQCAHNAIGCRLVLIQRLKTTTQTIVCIIHQRWLLLFAFWAHRRENLTPK